MKENYFALVQRYEERLIRQALRAADNNRTHAAASLGMQRTTLIEKMRKLGLLERHPAKEQQ